MRERWEVRDERKGIGRGDMRDERRERRSMGKGGKDER